MKTRIFPTVLLATLVLGDAAAGQSPAELTDLQAKYRRMEFHDGFAKGTELLRRFPANDQLRVLTIMHQYRAGAYMEAGAAAESLYARKPASRWAKLAHAYGAHERGDMGDRGVAAVDRVLETDPGNGDLVALRIGALARARRAREALAYADSMLTRMKDTVPVLMAKGAVMLNEYWGAPKRDTAMISPIMETFARASRSGRPDALHAHAGASMSLGRGGEAYPLMKRAVELAPRSADIRDRFWASINARTDVTIEEKRREAEADILSFLALRKRDAVAMAAAASGYGKVGMTSQRADMRARLLAEHPGSPQAQSTRYDLVSIYGDSVRRRLIADSAAGAAEYVRRLREFIALPSQPSGQVLAQAYHALWSQRYMDTTMTNEELLEHADRFTRVVQFDPGSTGVTIPRMLADRGIGLDLAEQMVRSKLDRRRNDVTMMHRVGILATVGDYADALATGDAVTNDLLGWIEYRRGRTAEAEKLLAKAAESAPKYSMTHYHLGRIREAAGDREEARLHYVRGAVSARYQGSKESGAALRRLHLASGGSVADFEAYFESLKAAERSQRRAAIAATRIATPRQLPAFSLPQLDSGLAASQSTVGKIAVINFWGTWCGPCVAEASDIQKFHDRFKGDPDVVFLTISNDKSSALVRDFLKRRGLSFPVAVDSAERFVKGAAEIGPFPTTWFVDREGKIAFVHEGASNEMFEEFVWRVELLKGDTGAKAGATVEGPAPALPDRPELTRSGALPPHDPLPHLLREFTLTPAQHALVNEIRARFRPRYERLYAQVLDTTRQGPEPLFALRALEREEQGEAREVLPAELRARFDEAVAAMTRKRQSMIRVGGE